MKFLDEIREVIREERGKVASILPYEWDRWKAEGIKNRLDIYDWKSSGFGPEDASKWARIGVPHYRAAEWSASGHTPDDASEWKAGSSLEQMDVWAGIGVLKFADSQLAPLDVTRHWIESTGDRELALTELRAVANVAKERKARPLLSVADANRYLRHRETGAPMEWIAQYEAAPRTAPPPDWYRSGLSFHICSVIRRFGLSPDPTSTVDQGWVRALKKNSDGWFRMAPYVEYGIRVGLSPDATRRIADTRFPVDQLPQYEKGSCPTRELVAVIEKYQRDAALRRPSAPARPKYVELSGHSSDDIWQANEDNKELAEFYGHEGAAHSRAIEDYERRERSFQREIRFPKTEQ